MAEEVDGDQYPLTMITGSTLHVFGGGSRSSRASKLKSFTPRAWINISTNDSKRYELNPGDKVKIISALGEITAVIRVSDDLDQGLLFMPSSFPDAPINVLFSYESSRSLKTCPVRLERIDDND